MTDRPRRHHHRCPGPRCQEVVPDALLACPRHWAVLPADVQRNIYRTARLLTLHPDRRAALADARRVWADA